MYNIYDMRVNSLLQIMGQFFYLHNLHFSSIFLQSSLIFGHWSKSNFNEFEVSLNILNPSKMVINSLENYLVQKRPLFFKCTNLFRMKCTYLYLQKTERLLKLQNFATTEKITKKILSKFLQQTTDHHSTLVYLKSKEIVQDSIHSILILLRLIFFPIHHFLKPILDCLTDILLY